MSEPDDVYEYVNDELERQAVKTIDVRRLLKYIKTFDTPEKQRHSVAMVYMHHHRTCLPIFQLMFALVLSHSYNIFRSYTPLVHARHNTESGDPNRI